jgi:predicted RNA binding protein YcfA (HicA-like mRNA interferase family)
MIGYRYDKGMKSADLIKRLEQAGWQLRNVRGSHHIYSHPVRGGHISVPHPKKDLGIGLAQKLLKQAGLK